MSLSKMRKQQSVVSARGGIQGKEGVIGEDGEVEHEDSNESDASSSSNSANGMRTRQRKTRSRKRLASGKLDAARQRKTATGPGAKAPDGEGQPAGKGTAGGDAKLNQQTAGKPAASKAQKSANKPQGAQAASSTLQASQSLLTNGSSMKTMSIREQNAWQRSVYRDVLPKFLYRPMTPLPDLSEHTMKHIEVRVHKAYVSRQNKAFRYRNFFGVDQYTSDSDIVCILQHTGQIRVPDLETDDKTFEAYSVIFKVLRNRA